MAEYPLFSENRIPLGINYGVSGGPQFSTTIIVSGQGKEQRIARWGQPLHQYSFQRGENNPLNDLELTQLREFQAARKGSLEGFRFRDWADYYTATETLGTGDGSRKSWQLLKTYQWANEIIFRPIYKPVEGTQQVYLGAVLQSSGWTVNPSSGILSFDAAPPAGVQVRCQTLFDVPVRFESDSIKFRQIASTGRRSLWTLEDVRLSEVRVKMAQDSPLTAPPQYCSASLPIGWDIGTVGGPTYRTDVIAVGQGFEQRIQRQNVPRRNWTVTGYNYNKTQLANMLAAFWVCRGAASSFAYFDRQTNNWVRVRFESDSIDFRFLAMDQTTNLISNKALFANQGFGLIECL